LAAFCAAPARSFLDGGLLALLACCGSHATCGPPSRCSARRQPADRLLGNPRAL